MPVLLSILGVLAVAAFWCYRIQASSRLTDESVRAIEDPAVAAAALLIALASRGGAHGPRRPERDPQRDARRDGHAQGRGVVQICPPGGQSRQGSQRSRVALLRAVDGSVAAL